MFRSFSAKNVVWTSLVLVLPTLLAYSNSFHVPFYLDDIGSIANNPNFKDASLSSLFADYQMRVIGYYTLFLDFQINKLSVTGYHYSNLCIHVLNGLVVYFLVRKLCWLSELTVTSTVSNYVAVLAALVFLLHPLQTQSVTYIVQRLSSLVALFYLASVCCYIYARSLPTSTSKFVLSFGCLLFAVCAIFTKQNAVTLPLVLVFAEFIFFNRNIARKVILAGLIALVSAGLLYFIFPSSLGTYVNKLDLLTRETRDITRLEYFLAQLPILWIYIGKFFWPVGLHLEYGKSIEDFGRSVSIIAGLAHILVISGALLLRKKLPLLAFGISFFYGAHFVESGIIPIRDLMFEHRTYLPNFGLVLVVLSVSSLVWKRLVKSGKAAPPLVFSVMILIVLSYMTYQRNEQWLDPQMFYENELVYSPNNLRVLHNYAEYSGRMGDLDKSEALIGRMYEAADKYHDGKLDGNMVNTHVVLLMTKGQFKDAIRLAKKLLQQPLLHPRTRVHVLSNIGTIYTTFGQYDRAEPYFSEAYSISGMTSKSLLAYAFVLLKNGKYQPALEVIDEIKRINPKNSKALQLENMIDEKSGSDGTADVKILEESKHQDSSNNAEMLER